MANGWFIAGTDTGVGKTYVAQGLLGALARDGRRALGMKPVASGCQPDPTGGLRSDDAQALISMASVEASYHDVNPYAFEPAIAPHVAAELAGVEIRLGHIRDCFSRLCGIAEYIVVEGAGGWLTPISKTQTMADVAQTCGLPIILVVGMRLGCLNHALLTQAAIAQYGLPLAGWVANHIDPTMERFDENVETLRQRIRAPLLAVMPHHSVDAGTSGKRIVELLSNLIA